MTTYEPKGFRDIFDSPLGQNIWKYLNSIEGINRMILTSELGHPAAEGIGDKLIEQFGEDVKIDRIKQATGHMIKNVMENNGFVHKQKSVSCRKKTEVFVFASRYERK